MGIEFTHNLARFCDVVSVDEAEGLLERLQKNPATRIDLSSCAHLHPANLQVLNMEQGYFDGANVFVDGIGGVGEAGGWQCCSGCRECDEFPVGVQHDRNRTGRCTTCVTYAAAAIGDAMEG